MEKAAASPDYRAAVLAWVLRHRAAWLKDGIGSAPSVDAATEEVRADMDPLREFWEECCEFGVYAVDDTLFATPADLRQRYLSWVAEQPGNAHAIDDSSFFSLLRGRGAESSTRRVEGTPTRVWKGVRVRKPMSIRVSRR